MGRTMTRRTAAAVAAGALAALVLSACANPFHGDVLPAAQISTTPDVENVEGSPAPELTVAPGTEQHAWRPDQPIVVNAVQGTLAKVVVTADDGTKVAGALSDDHLHWTSSGALVPGTAYKVRARMVGSGDTEPVARTVKLTTVDNAAEFRALISPRDGGTVGVGMPIIVTFTSPVAEAYRADVESRLTVASSEASEGAWHWVSPTQVQYRTKDYWPAHSKVVVGADLAGVQVNDGVWGASDREVHFSVGRSVVSVVDVSSDQMTVTIDGEPARTIPVTTGKDGFRTRGGTRVISEMLAETRMDAASTGTDPGDPEYYNLAVEYAMRMTNSGEFIHAAPWSVASQGHENVSHGCVGMSTENARWLFEHSRVGDVVTIVHSQRSLEPGNGMTQWNLSFDEWQAGSAL